MDYRITTRIEGATYEKLAQRARSERKTESVIVREALEAYLANTRTAYDDLMELGGLGIATGTPSDLSTNKSHLKGFGSNGPSDSAGHRSPRRASRRK